MNRFIALAATLLVACSFSPGRLAGGDAAVVDPDAADAAVIVPDASQCTAASAQCIGDTLRKCSGAGAMAMDRVCDWGCNTVSSVDAACYELAPSGGWEMQGNGDTTDFQGLGAVTIPAAAVIDTDAGTITGVSGSTFDYQTRAIGASGRSVGVFRFRSLTLGNVSVVGTNALALVANDGITLTGVLDAVPLCDFDDVRTPGPGGFAGGLNNFDGLPLPPGGGGAHGTTNDEAGGGGGHGGVGGAGANTSGSAGAIRGTPEIALLLGGSGGGGGDNHSQSGRGGGGGAALHFLSNGSIEIQQSGGVNAGGCGGRSGNGTNDGGGGGGSGGAILIEGRTVTIEGTVAVNGGGGGGGNTGADSVGQKGQLSRVRASGGPAGGGGAGADGAAGANAAGINGSTANGGGGGGGGGIGRIRVNTRNGSVSRTNAILSPGPGDPSTTYTEGQAAVR